MTVEHHFNPDYRTLESSSVSFSCPHIRFGQPAVVVGSERRWILGYLRSHDAYGFPTACIADVRRRYQKRYA